MLNSCSFIGNLGRDPEVKSTQRGDKVANLSIGCTEKWKDRDGNRQERTTWVPVVIWGALADVAERYLRKGSKVYVSGKFSVRKWQDRDGQDRYATEIILNGHDAKLVMLDGPQGDQRGERKQPYDDRPGEFAEHRRAPEPRFDDDLDSEVPF